MWDRKVVMVNGIRLGQIGIMLGQSSMKWRKSDTKWGKHVINIVYSSRLKKSVISWGKVVQRWDNKL